jgi:hypothetical protein
MFTSREQTMIAQARASALAAGEPPPTIEVTPTCIIFTPSQAHALARCQPVRR